MARRVFVCLSQAGATAARWSGKLADVAHFEADDAGLPAFEAWLARSAGTPAVVMVDSADEDYRFESLPHTAGRDRQELLGRKLKQMYRGTPFTSATVSAPGARPASGRREDLVLFCALTAADSISPWLRSLRVRGLPLVAVHPLPTVTPVAAKLLKLDAPHLLIISRNQAGLRQTYLKNGAFRITRLTPSHAADERDIDRLFAGEVRNTRLYLDSQTLTTADETVQVAILDQDDSLADLHRQIEALGSNLRCQRLSRADMIKRLGLPLAALDASSDALHLRLLGGAVTAPNLAPADMVAGYRLYRTRRWLFSASGAVAAAGGLWFGSSMYRVSGLDSEAAEAAAQSQRYQKMYEQLTREFPVAPASAAVLEKTVELAQRLRGAAHSPEPLLVAVSQGLDAAPSIVLRTIDWRYAKPANLPGGLPQAVGTVSGEISPFDGNHRAAVETIRQFAERLRTNPAVAEVRVLKYPVDDSSQQVLSGSTNARTAAKTSAYFELAVQMREPAAGP